MGAGPLCLRKPCWKKMSLEDSCPVPSTLPFEVDIFCFGLRKNILIKFFMYICLLTYVYIFICVFRAIGVDWSYCLITTEVRRARRSQLPSKS